MIKLAQNTLTLTHSQLCKTLECKFEMRNTDENDKSVPRSPIQNQATKDQYS